MDEATNMLATVAVEYYVVFTYAGGSVGLLWGRVGRKHEFGQNILNIPENAHNCQWAGQRAAHKMTVVEMAVEM